MLCLLFLFFPFNYSVYLIKHGTTMIDCKVFSIRYATLLEVLFS